MDAHDPCVVTFFTNYAAASKNEMVVDLEDLVRRIRTSTGPDKASLPWLKLARFGESRTAKGSLRWDGNMLSISGIEADYDGEIMGIDAAVQLLHRNGVLAIVYTSPSHTEDAPRWRVLCPLSQEYTPDERDRFLARLNGLFDGIFSGESWTRSQSYYYGSINANPSHRVELLGGTPLDLSDEFDLLAIKKSEKPKTNGAAHHGPPTPPGAITDKRINGLIDTLLANIRAAPDGQKYFTLRDISFTVGGYLHLTGWSDLQAIEACVGALPSAKDWAHARKVSGDAIAAGRLKPLELADRPGHAPRMQQPRAREKPAEAPGPVPPSDPPRQVPPSDPPGGVEESGGPPGGDPPPPVGDPGGPDRTPREIPTITCIAGELPRMLREAQAALLTSGAEIYQRGMLVQPAQQQYTAVEDWESHTPRVTHSAALVPLTAPALLTMLCHAARWMKWNAQVRPARFVDCDPPERLVQMLLFNRTGWPFPVVRGVLTCPTLRPNGSMLVTPGYDPMSRYVLMFPEGLEIPEIPEHPTKEDAKVSLERLDRLLDSYPWVGRPSRSVGLCMLMTQVLRCAMTTSPLLAVSAKAPGTGKSHLVDLASTIAVGRPSPAMGTGKKDEEFEKGLNTMLISGVPGFSIDNVSRDLDSSTLNMATERPRITIRVFGKLESVEVEVACAIYMTGNNLAIVDEQGRRTMRAELDAGQENPERRHFDGDPIHTALADRGRYIADILTIARAYHLSGERAAPFPLGSYGSWSHFVREPLIWLGCADPAITMEQAKRDDHTNLRLRAMLSGWHKEFGATPITVADALAKSQPEGFYQVLREQFPTHSGGVDTARIGNWLRRFAGRVSYGMRFVKDEGVTHGVARWYVENVENI